MRKAVIFGATGLVGSYLLKELIECGTWDQITVIVRKSTGTKDPRVTEIIDPMTELGSFTTHITGNDLFICLGTTIAKAGSQEAFEAVDLQLPSAIAKIAAANGMQNCAVISSIGANPSSRNFYLKTKGMMEENMEKTGFMHLYIFRPSMLLGARRESRPAESAGKIFMQMTSFLFVGPLKKYRAIQASSVAKAMRFAMQSLPESAVFESDKIASISKKAL